MKLHNLVQYFCNLEFPQSRICLKQYVNWIYIVLGVWRACGGRHAPVNRFSMDFTVVNKTTKRSVYSNGIDIPEDSVHWGKTEQVRHILHCFPVRRRCLVYLSVVITYCVTFGEGDCCKEDTSSYRILFYYQSRPFTVYKILIKILITRLGWLSSLILRSSRHSVLEKNLCCQSPIRFGFQDILTLLKPNLTIKFTIIMSPTLLQSLGLL